MKIEELVRIEYAGQPVLTSKQLAEFFEVPPHRIKDNFRHNKKHFTVGVHYFKVEGEELKALKDSLNERIMSAGVVENFNRSEDVAENFNHVAGKISPVGNPSTVQSVFSASASLILFTAQGAARIAKTLHSDNAWKVYNELEQFYFDNHPVAQSEDARISSLEAEVEGLKNTFGAWLEEMEKLPNPEVRADKLLAVAEKISNPELRDKALCKVFNLLLGKNIF